VPPETVRVLQRVGLLHQVALLVLLKARHAAFRVGERDHVAAHVVLMSPATEVVRMALSGAMDGEGN
ncbi:hypothetical protein ACI0YT_004293, partial [Cronobacter dublinensis]